MSKSKRKIASYTGRRGRGFSVRDLTRVALMTAILAVCGWITIPLPEPMVPFTLQTFGVFLCLLILGGRDGTLAIAAYLLLGAVGAPVFSSFRGGLGVLLGSTGGYLTGFLAMGLLYWALTARGEGGAKRKLLACVLGLLLCYAFGTAWFVAVYLQGGKAVSVLSALLLCVVPYLLPDLLKLTLAAVIAKRVG